jgi:hypothetical protein
MVLKEEDAETQQNFRILTCSFFRPDKCILESTSVHSTSPCSIHCHSFPGSFTVITLTFKSGKHFTFCGWFVTCHHMSCHSTLMCHMIISLEYRVLQTVNHAPGSCQTLPLLQCSLAVAHLQFLAGLWQQSMQKFHQPQVWHRAGTRELDSNVTIKI